jgi:mevalonate kinase
MTGSGHGKVILLGEHAVVHGHPALAMAIDRTVTVEVRPGAGVVTGVLAGRLDDDSTTARAVQAVATALGRPMDFDLEVTSDVPLRSGLGSSAAFSVALVRALTGQAGWAPEVEVLAMRAERLFHGNPSGVDVALAARGGVGTFTRAAGFVPVSARALTLIVGLSGEPRDTAARVAEVAGRLVSDPRSTRLHLGELGMLATAGTRALVAGDLATLGGVMDVAHDHLVALALSTDRLDAMVAAARAAGAIGAKLTGAGGGGAMIALAPDRQAEVLAALGPEAFVVHTAGRVT